MFGAFFKVTFSKSSTVILGLFNEVDEFFLDGVFFLNFLLLLGVVGVFAFCPRKNDGGRGGGGGGGGGGINGIEDVGNGGGGGIGIVLEIF